MVSLVSHTCPASDHSQQSPYTNLAVPSSPTHLVLTMHLALPILPLLLTLSSTIAAPLSGPNLDIPSPVNITLATRADPTVNINVAGITGGFYVAGGSLPTSERRQVCP